MAEPEAPPGCVPLANLQLFVPRKPGDRSLHMSLLAQHQMKIRCILHVHPESRLLPAGLPYRTEPEKEHATHRVYGEEVPAQKR